MFTSEAEGFRTRQALSDLRSLIASTPGEVFDRIAEAIPQKTMTPATARSTLSTLGAGEPVPENHREASLVALQTVAALPKQDFQAFTLATMVVLAETLSGRDAGGDLAWHWQTFREYYRAMAATERAAIVQAIRRTGLVDGRTDGLPVTVPDRATASAAALRALLEAHLPKGLAPPDPGSVADLAARVLAGFDDPDAATLAARLWASDGAELCMSAPAAILAGFRHLYETRDGWCPDTLATIPLLDPPPGVAWPR